MTPLAGSLGDLVARAEGRPIYCIKTSRVHYRLMDAVIDSFRRECPSAEFVSAGRLYRNSDDRRSRWRAAVERHGAGIVVTRGEGLPEHADPFAGLAGEHVVGIDPELEIERLFLLGRPVGWHAVVFPTAYWLARFAVEPSFEIQPSRYARLVPATDAELFRPIIGPWPPRDAGGGA
jgi:hypothetical protein